MFRLLKILAPASFLVFSMMFVPIDTAYACTSSGSSGSLSYGSSISGETVTVCVGSYSSTPATATSSTTTATTTTTKKSTKKTTTSNLKTTAKTTTTKTTTKAVTCPTAAQLAAMPKSADAAERWIETVCNPPKTASKSVAKAAPKPKAKKLTKTTSITTNLTSPGTSSRVGAAVSFVPNSIRASYFPQTVLAIGQRASFSADPVLHYKTQRVLGRMAEVEFTPIALNWTFSDGLSGSGNPYPRSFDEEGSYQAVARVSYQVKFRLLGETSWQQVQGVIISQSNRLTITVGESLAGEGESGEVLLVGQLCTNRPQAFGCN